MSLASIHVYFQETIVAVEAEDGEDADDDDPAKSVYGRVDGVGGRSDSG